MFKYQITVSLNGVFLFRTDVITEQDKAANTATLIKSAMPLANVEVMRWQAGGDLQEINNKLEWPWS